MEQGKSVLYKQNLAQLVNQRTIIKLSSKNTLSDALDALVDKHQQGIAVFKDIYDEFSFQGTITLFDIIFYMISFYEKDNDVQTPIGTVGVRSWITNWKELDFKTKFFVSTPLSFVIDLRNRRAHHKHKSETYRPKQLYVGDPISSAITKLVLDHERQVPVFQSEKIYGMVTQDEIFWFLAPMMQQILPSNVSSKSLRDVLPGCLNKKIISVNSNQIAIQAFQSLVEKDVTAIAVVDSVNGSILANFSASEIIETKFRSIAEMSLPVLEFLQEFSNTPMPPISCKDDISCIDLALTLANHKKHRVWVIDQDKKPIGVVSVYDMLKLIYDYTLS